MVCLCCDGMDVSTSNEQLTTHVYFHMACIINAEQTMKHARVVAVTCLSVTIQPRMETCASSIPIVFLPLRAPRVSVVWPAVMIPRVDQMSGVTLFSMCAMRSRRSAKYVSRMKTVSLDDVVFWSVQPLAK